MREYCSMLFLGLYRLRKLKNSCIDNSVIKAYRQAIKRENERLWLKRYEQGTVDGFKEIYLIESKDLAEAKQLADEMFIGYSGEPIITKACENRFKVKYTFYHEL